MRHPCIEHDHVVGYAHDQFHVVLDQNHSDAEIGDSPKQHAQCVLVGTHQPGGGFIEQQHARTHRQCAGDLDQAAVDVRQIAGRRRQCAVVTDECQQSFGDALRRPRWLRPPNMPPSCPRRSATNTFSSTLMVTNNLVV